MPEIITVKDKKDWALFHRVPHRVYQGDPNWICPLEMDVEGTFHPDTNEALEHSEAVCFVLLDEQQKPAGRVAAFVDHKRNEEQPYSLGGIGFFECIRNKEYAFALFAKAEKWLKERGAKAVDGPINFGEREKFWGLLVNGFFPPLFQENYNPPYYQQFFEEWGFIPYEQILTFRGDTDAIPMDRFNKLMDTLGRRYKIRNDHLHIAQLEKYASDFCEVYNAAFQQKEHFKPVTKEQAMTVVQEGKAAIDPKIMVITYYDEKPVGFCVCVPDLNTILKPAKGKLNWKTIPGFLWRKWTTKKWIAKGFAFGVHPDYRNKGVAAITLGYISRDENRSKYPEMYFTTVRTHNKEAVSVYLKMGVAIDRVHVSYRKALAEGIELQPYEFMEVPPLG